ncbi:MAG: hypothetical protein K8R41_09185 [Bacteroidales bacterium]|nr:hypothetical protein [Bacteroidales bacterium]
MKKTILLLIVIIFALTSCQKDWDQIVEDNQTNEEITSMSEMVVNSDFNWKTTKDIIVNFTGFDINEVIYIKSLDGDIYHKAFFNLGDNYSTKITIPTYALEINVMYKGASTNIPISGNEINYKFI